MVGLESFNTAYQRHRPSRSISEHPTQLQPDDPDNNIVRQQQREILTEMSRNQGNCIVIDIKINAVGTQ